MFSANSGAVAVTESLEAEILIRRIVSSVAVFTIDHALGDIYTCCDRLWSYSLRTAPTSSLWNSLALELPFIILRIRLSGVERSKKV